MLNFLSTLIFKMEEMERFELSVVLPTSAFKADALNQTPPHLYKTQVNESNFNYTYIIPYIQYFVKYLFTIG